MTKKDGFPMLFKRCTQVRNDFQMSVTLPGVILEIKGTVQKMQKKNHISIKYLTTKPGAFLTWNNPSLHLYFKPVVTMVNSPSLCFIISVTAATTA